MPEQKVERIRKTRKKEYFQSAEARKNIKKKKLERKRKTWKKKRSWFFRWSKRKEKKWFIEDLIFLSVKEKQSRWKKERKQKKYIYIEAKCVATWKERRESREWGQSERGREWKEREIRSTVSEKRKEEGKKGDGEKEREKDSASTWQCYISI